MSNILNRTIAPEISGFAPMSLPPFRTETLANGITLNILDGGEEPVNRLAMVWSVGTVDSPDEATAVMLPSLLREGCEGMTGGQIADTLESNGAWLNVATRLHGLALNVFSLNSTARVIFPLVARMIARPTFPAEAVESLCRKSASEKEVALRKPSAQAARLVREALYDKDSPMYNTVMPADILAVTPEKLARLHRTMLLGNCPTLYLSGRVDEDIVRSVAEAFSILEFDEKGRIERGCYLSKALAEPIVRVHDMPKSLQTGVRIEVPTIRRSHPDYDMLNLAVMALGGYFGSRLMENIREDKGYTYGIYSFLNPIPESTTAIIPCDCDNHFAADVVKEIDHEIERMATEPLPEAELAIVKSNQYASMASLLDSPFNISVFRERADLLGIDGDPLARQFEVTQKATATDLMEMMRRYIYQQPRIVALAGAQPG